MKKKKRQKEIITTNTTPKLKIETPNQNQNPDHEF